MISWKNHFLYQVDYQHWVNDKLLESCDKLSDEVRKREEGLPFRSIHGTVNHLLVINLKWLGRLQGEPKDYRHDQQIFEEWRELKLALKQTVRQTQHWLEAQSDAYFDGELHYRTSGGVEQRDWIHDVLTNFVTDCAHCRGQIAGLAVRLGAPSPEMDFIYYRRDMQESLAHAKLATTSRPG
ncbi:DinB family protein [Chitinimonas sp. PSY-7]|uniref:DinB family protein n=1 Tax=Chitinimonas sp. PSY-7 TaxID=3459088 RepID=UPI00403FE7E3